MTEYLFDHNRDQWCPGIAGESAPGVDYEHEHRDAEHEHEEMPDDLPTPVGHLPTIGSVLS